MLAVPLTFSPIARSPSNRQLVLYRKLDRPLKSLPQQQKQGCS
ncbi:hypothetical protein QT971_31035 [Microcoleus sp. herbarium19]